MLPEYFVYVGMLFVLVGTYSYLKDTLKGTTKPNKVTFFMWSLAPLIAFWASISQGVGIQSIMTLIVGLAPLSVFFASFINKQAYWKISRNDLLCGLLAFIGLMLRRLSGIGNIAILFSIFAYGMAGLPTVIKSYHHPETENANGHLGSMLFALVTLLTIDEWKFEVYGFPLYIFLIMLVTYSLVKFRLGKTLIPNILAALRNNKK